MTEHPHEDVRHLFDMVLDVPASQRDSVLDRECAGDDGLKQRILAMITAAEDDRFLGDATADVDPDAPGACDGPGAFTAASASHETVGQQIDRYKLLEQIGEGGFGSVWAAEQKRPVKRRVALKIIKLGMDTKQVIARFEAERQALAMMDHPNIAKVLDAGTTETGRPFFVMELVKGVPILEYCDTEKLDTKARLDLFARVCNAIQHAHQKGIIHRDIKPSNVLVTLHDGVPVPKVIDFGIAKATNQELTEKTIYTQHRQMVGTPAYMSPEQAEMSGLDIDTRSDIYSLGVLLYELLTGTTPFTQDELASAGFEGMMRMIREIEPHKPSTRLSSLGNTATQTAQQRRADVKHLGLILRGDLDWIVMKCLEKDRTRRYETASGLAADIRRHLDDEPVTAGPPGAGYRLGKFVKRHRGRVAAGIVVAAALVLGVVGTSTGLVWALDEKSRADSAAMSAEAARQESERERFAAEEARRRAEEQTAVAEAQLARSEEFKGFMVELLGSIEPDREFPERSLAIRELLDTAYTKILAGDVRDDVARAEVIDLLDGTAGTHKWYDLQIDLRYARLDEAKRLYGREDPRTQSTVIDLAWSLTPEGRAREAYDLLEEYIPNFYELLESDEVNQQKYDLLGLFANIQRLYGGYESALEYYEYALKMAIELETPDGPWDVYYHQIMISRVLWRLGRLEEALQASDDAKSAFEALRISKGPGESAGRQEAANQTFAINGASEDLNVWFVDSWTAYRADLMMDLGRYAEALELYLDAEETRAGESLDDFTRHLWGAGAARALQNLGRTPEALSKSEQALEGMRVTRAPVWAQRDVSRQILMMLAELGRDAEHERALSDFLEPPEKPLVIFADGLDLPYAPSGFMGEVDKAVFRQSLRESPYEGERCFEWRVEPGESWVAMGWMEPADNWGDLPGGYDLTGARRLSFAARGKAGGEIVNVGIGLIDTGDYPDTLRTRMTIELSTEWQRFEMPLEGLDLSTVRTAFVIESELTVERQSIFFDDIRFE